MTDQLDPSAKLYPDLSIDVVYCDDIRAETRGRRSLVGVYTRELILDEFPNELAQLCVQATVRWPKSQSYNITKIIFELPDRPPLEQTVSYPESAGQGGAGLRIVRHTQRFKDVKLEKPGLCVVKVEVDGQLYCGNSLRILDQLRKADEGADEGYNSTAIDLSLAYLSKYMPRSRADRANSCEAFVDVLQAIIDDNIEYELDHPDQPMWIPISRNNILAFKTRPWHKSETLVVTRNEKPVDFQITIDNSIAFILKFDFSVILHSGEIDVSCQMPAAKTENMGQ